MAAPLASRVRAKFSEAKARGALTFADSKLAVIDIAGIPIQCRYCPSLAKKPVRDGDDKAKPVKPAKKFDPFESPVKELFIASRPEAEDGEVSHTLVLNKFPIINNHFILATKENKPQTHLLEPNDLFQIYQCLKEWSTSDSGQTQDDSRRLFAFFNSGDHSGASQSHRHVQFLPVEDMQESSGGQWALLVDRIGKAPSLEHDTGLKSLSALPFVHFGARLPTDPDALSLWNIYTRLYTASAASVRRYRDTHDDLALHSTGSGDLPISYNLAMTGDCMVISPRRSEGLMVKRDDGSDIDFVALNGTFLAGTMMVKNEELWHELQKKPAKLKRVFMAIGLPAMDTSLALTKLDLDVARFSELTKARALHNL